MKPQFKTIIKSLVPKNTIISWKNTFPEKERYSLVLIGIIGNLRFYQIIYPEQQIDILFPKAVRYLDYFWLMIPEQYDLQELYWKEFYDYLSPYYEELTNQDINRACLRLFRDIIESLPNIKEDYELLDFGCGTSISKEIFLHKHIVGYDINTQMVEKARQQNNEVIDKASFFTLPANTFDGSIACFVFHMGINRSDLQNLSRIIKPNGFIVSNYYKHLGEKQISECLSLVGFSDQKLVVEEGRFGSVYVYRKK